MSNTMNTYARLPVTFSKGDGAWLWDTNGERYLDAISGIAVCNIGHANPRVTQAIKAQAERLSHTSNIYTIEHQEHLANKLCELSGLSSAFFCNSGAEANETAIKIARKYGNDQDINTPKIITMQRSFHGRTLAALSATGNSAVHAGFAPLVEGFIHVPHNDVDAVKSINDDSVVAILVEPIQGEGGVRVPDEGYLKQLRALCDERNWLLMLDEVQAGMARTGAWFGFQHDGVLPDVVSLAKGLGNGFPIGACLAGEKARHILQPGNHGTTYGGSPLACYTALAVIEEIETRNLCERATELGKKISNGIAERTKDLEGVLDIRHKGMMIGVELAKPCGELVKLALEKKLLINVTSGNTIRLLPPLIIDNAQADEIITTVSDLIISFLSKK